MDKKVENKKDHSVQSQNAKKVELSQEEIERRRVLLDKEVLTDQERLELAELDERMEAHRDSRPVEPVDGRFIEDAEDERDEIAGKKTGAE